MDTVVAPAVLQESVLLLPFRIVEGDAVKEEITGGLATFTVTVTWAVTVPLALAAVRV
jgi:hypothetical protein